MNRRFSLLLLLTALIVLSSTYFIFAINQRPGLPFSVDIVDAHTAVVEPIPGVTWPAAFRPGDKIDLAALPRASRIAIRVVNNLSALPLRRTYTFTVRRGAGIVALPVETVRWNATSSTRPLNWITRAVGLLLTAIALLTLWRGRDRAAAGLALWAVSFVAAYDAAFVPSDGAMGLGLLMGEIVLILLARIGFYIMAESMLGGNLSGRAQRRWRASFVLLLALGAAQAAGGSIIFVVTGWAQLVRPEFGIALTAPYLVPVALLFAGYRRAAAARQLRLRWMLGSSVVLLAGIFLSNTPALGSLASLITSRLMIVMAMLGFLYAVLRHRVVDVAVVLNRALVYGATTSLLLGLLALLESLIERTALGGGASLLLELAVPVGLGAALSTVHRRIESTVEQYLFRRQYREDTALRGFARECAFVTRPESLLELAVEQMSLHTGAPWVALYEHAPEGFVRARQRGSPEMPSRLDADDLALVKLRARVAEVHLSDTPSALGREGHVFPLRMRGNLLGILVIGPRPDEHYVADERELFAHVSHEVGAALFALRAQAGEALLNEARAREAALSELLRAYRATAKQ